MRQNFRALYDLLIAPVQGQLVPTRTLVIEADGPLTSISIEALLDPHDRYLGDNSAVVSSLGFYYYSRLRLTHVCRQPGLSWSLAFPTQKWQVRAAQS